MNLYDKMWDAAEDAARAVANNVEAELTQSTTSLRETEQIVQDLRDLLDRTERAAQQDQAALQMALQASQKALADSQITRGILTDQVQTQAATIAALQARLDALDPDPPEAPDVSAYIMQPFSNASVWNTPKPRTAIHGGRAHAYAQALRSVKGQLNYATYTTPVNYGTREDGPLTIVEVAPGYWRPTSTATRHVVEHAPANVTIAGDMVLGKPVYNDNGGITFSNTPDGFMAFIQPDGTVITGYKVCWSKDGPSSRTLIARAGSVKRYSVTADSLTVRGARASGFDVLAGLIRKGELQNGIFHALALALTNTQLRQLTDTDPGFVWPARSVDSNAREVYLGVIPMGQHFTLDPSANLGSLGLTPEGMVLGRALRDYGAYVCDRAAWTALYAEQGIESGPAERAKSDWQNKLLPLVVPVLNTTVETLGAR